MAAALGQLHRLTQERWRNLPDDARGRAMLEAMLICGLTGPEAHDRAPWIRPAELGALIASVDAAGRVATTPARLGRLVQLTDAERTQHRIFALRPFDVDWDVVQERRRAAKVAYNVARNKRERDERRNREGAFANGGDLDERAEQLSLLIGPCWTRVPDLVAIVGKSGWRAKDGRKITGNSLSQAVKRALDELLRCSPPRIQSEIVTGKNGQKVRRVRVNQAADNASLSP